MASSNPTPTPICIDYAELLHTSPTTPLKSKLLDAYGPDGLGILTISNVPGYLQRRTALLPLACRLSHLPPPTLATLTDAASSYNFGWSCGQEALENEAVDARKGSFYANPLLDQPTTDPHLIATQPAYCRPNIWPRQQLPELEKAFKDLSRIMYDTGILLARHIDQALQPPDARSHPLTRVLQQSTCHKGRLLCYLPPPLSSPLPRPSQTTTTTHDAEEEDKENNATLPTTQSQSQWCGWHTDHGCLTGLTAALYTHTDGTAVEDASLVDPRAGLYAKTRHGDVVQVVIPPDHIAFQLGEVFQILSGGKLQATPHCVAAPSDSSYASRLGVEGGEKRRYCRNTFALFMQPRWDTRLDSIFLPSSVGEGGVGVEVASWTRGMTFGAFSKERFKMYYK